MCHHPLPALANLPTGVVKDGRRGRRLGGDRVGIGAASLPGVERRAEPEEKDVIAVGWSKGL
jgi:hypothetical protein